jgi:hypothetical protein
VHLVEDVHRLPGYDGRPQILDVGTSIRAGGPGGPEMHHGRRRHPRGDAAVTGCL